MKIQTITSRDNACIKQIKKIASKSAGYKDFGHIWIEGEHLCDAYLSSQSALSLQTVVMVHSHSHVWLKRLSGVIDKVIVVPDDLMASISTLPSASTIGFLLNLPQTTIEIHSNRHTVVLDRVQDAGNVGSILRSAAAFGVQQILATEGTALLWSNKVLRAAMGAHFSLHLVEGLEASAINLNVPLLATHVHEGISLNSLDRTHPSKLYPCAWFFGHEGQGLSPVLLNKANLRVQIEQTSQESLNVAAAAAICLYASSLAQKL